MTNWPIFAIPLSTITMEPNTKNIIEVIGKRWHSMRQWGACTGAGAEVNASRVTHRAGASGYYVFPRSQTFGIFTQSVTLAQMRPFGGRPKEILFAR